MEKKSSLNENSMTAQPYELMPFDAQSRKKDKEPVVTMEEIHARIKAREEEGYERGYSAGQVKALGDAENEKRAWIEKIEGIIKVLENYREQKVKDMMPEIVDLSMEIARKVIFREIKLDRTIIMDVAGDAVKRVGEREDGIIIKVNPLDYEMMINVSESLRERAGLKNISIEPVTAISPGGCYIETQTGEIDARVEEKIVEIENVLNTATNSEV